MCPSAVAVARETSLKAQEEDERKLVYNKHEKSMDFTLIQRDKSSLVRKQWAFRPLCREYKNAGAFRESRETAIVPRLLETAEGHSWCTGRL